MKTEGPEGSGVLVGPQVRCLGCHPLGALMKQFGLSGWQAPFCLSTLSRRTEREADEAEAGSEGVLGAGKAWGINSAIQPR